MNGIYDVEPDVIQFLREFSNRYGCLAELQDKTKSTGNETLPRFAVLIEDILHKANPSDIVSTYQYESIKPALIDLVLHLVILLTDIDMLCDTYFMEKSVENFTTIVARVTHLIENSFWLHEKIRSNLPKELPKAFIPLLIKLMNEMKKGVFLKYSMPKIKRIIRKKRSNVI